MADRHSHRNISAMVTAGVLLLLIVVVLSTIPCGTASDAEWRKRDLADTVSHNTDIAMVIGPDDRVHVAHMAYSNNDLWLAYSVRTEDKWAPMKRLAMQSDESSSRSISIALDSRNGVHICASPWFSDDEMIYLTNSGGSWESMAIPVGRYRADNVMDVDSSDGVHILASVMVMDHQDPDGTDYTYDYLRHVYIQNGEYTISDLFSTDLNGGLFIPHSLQFDAQDGVHAAISFVDFDGASYNPNFTRADYVAGKFGSLVNHSICTEDGFANINPCIALDRDSNVHVVFYEWNGVNHSLVYGKWTGTEWETQDTGFFTDSLPGSASLAIDTSGRVHIAYFHVYSKWQYLEYGYSVDYVTNQSGEWDSEEVDGYDELNIYGVVQIAVDSDDVLHMSYYYSKPISWLEYDQKVRYATTGSSAGETSNEGNTMAIALSVSVAVVIVVCGLYFLRSRGASSG